MSGFVLRGLGWFALDFLVLGSSGGSCVNCVYVLLLQFRKLTIGDRDWYGTKGAFLMYSSESFYSLALIGMQYS
jgi:hypothetical protein